MISRKKFYVIKVLIVLLLGSLLTSGGLAQQLNFNQWVDLLGVDNESAFEYLVDMGADAVPGLQDALANKWDFHAYIPQRTNVVRVLAEMNDISTVPALKLALIMEPSIRTNAVDALLALEDLEYSKLLAELLEDQVDYQPAKILMLQKLLDDKVDIIAILEDTFDVLAQNSIETSTVDKTADFIARFIISDKAIIVPPQQITREMIMAALLAQQQAKESGQSEVEEVDINQQLAEFLIEQLNHVNDKNRMLALRTIGRLADLARGLEIASEHDLNQFVPALINNLENRSELVNNRILAARALEQIVPASPEAIRAFVNIITDERIDSEVMWSAIRTLEIAGATAVNEYIFDLIEVIPELEVAMKWRLASLFVYAGRENPLVIDAISNLETSSDSDTSFFANQILVSLGVVENNTNSQHFSVAPAGIPAFPGAEGRGALATGGRGGEVYIVTNIKNSGPGSLRDAISKPNRTIVFAISGTIESRAQLKTAANITIAGQTAPGSGVTVADFPFLVGGSNSIVRFMRFRLGEREGLTSSDALNVDRFISDVILDHVSVTWGTDEVFSSYDNENITVQYSMFGEGLNWLNHSAVGLWGPRSTYHHNLIYTNKTRHPKLSYLGDIVEFNNNVVYNWRERSIYTGSQGLINFIGNYLKPGPETRSSVRGQLLEPDGDNVRVYIEGNMIEGNDRVNQDNWAGVTKHAVRMSVPYDAPPLTIHTAEEAYEIVLATAGAYLPKRDAADQRAINDVINGTGQVILRQSEVGGFPIMDSHLAPLDSDKDGMPDMWEVYHGLDPFNPADRNYDRTGDGYTNLEEYLNALVEDHPLWP